MAYLLLAWNKVENAKGYKLYISLNKPAFEKEVDVIETEYKLESPEYASTYYWKVVPYNEGGDAENCPTWSFTTQPKAPTAASLVKPKDGERNIDIIEL